MTTSAIELSPDSNLPRLHAGVALAPSDPATALDRVKQAVALSDPDRPEELLHSLWGAASVRARALEAAERLVRESQRFQTQRGEAIGLAQIAFLAPGGSSAGREAASRAFELALLSHTTVVEKIGAGLHIRHLLESDPPAAAQALLV